MTKPTVPLELRGALLERLMERLPGVREAALQRYRGRITETALRAVPLFRALSEPALRALHGQAAVLSFAPDQRIVQEGEPGDALFVIICGLARVFHTTDARTLNLALLRSGDYFGEWSVLTGAPRTAAVAALTQVEVLRVDCRAFLDFVQRHPEVRDRIDQTAHNRHAQIRQGDAGPESAAELDHMPAEFEDIINDSVADRPPSD